MNKKLISIILSAIIMSFPLVEAMKPHNSSPNSAKKLLLNCLIGIPSGLALLAAIRFAINHNNDISADRLPEPQDNIAPNSVASLHKSTSVNHLPKSQNDAAPASAASRSARTRIDTGCIQYQKEHHGTINYYGWDSDTSENLDPLSTISLSNVMDLFNCAKNSNPQLSQFSQLDPLKNDNWQQVHELAVQCLNSNRPKAYEYASITAQYLYLMPKHIKDIVSCFILRDFSDAFSDRRFGSYNRIIFFNIHTGESDYGESDRPLIFDIITMDTTNNEELSKLDNLGIQFECEHGLFPDTYFDIVKIPFRNSLQKKILVRYLQIGLINYYSGIF